MSYYTIDCRMCGKTVDRMNGRHRFCASCGYQRSLMFSRLLGKIRRVVHSAVRRGELPNPRTLRCADCGAPATDYDHRDYSKPLEVEAVCRSCNRKRGPAKNHPFDDVVPNNARVIA